MPFTVQCWKYKEIAIENGRVLLQEWSVLDQSNTILQLFFFLGTSYDLQRSQKYRFFSTLPLPTKKSNGWKGWGILSEYVNLKNIKENVCWICSQGKNPLAKEATFCLQPCVSNIFKIKINTEDGLSWYPRGKKKIKKSGNWGSIISKIHLWKARRTIRAKALIFEGAWSISFFKIPTAFYLHTHNQTGLNCVWQTHVSTPLKSSSKGDATWASSSVNSVVIS